jgi:predicted PurR-regulated permease PerM
MPDPILDLGARSRSSTQSVDPKELSSPPTHGRRNVPHGRQVGWRSRDVVRAAGLVLAMYLALKLLWFANALFLVAFLGVLFSIAISAGVDRLERLRIPRGAGAALIVLSFFAILFAFGAWLAPTLREQGAELRQKLPEAVDRAEQWMNRRQSGFFGVLLGAGNQAPTRPSTATPSQPAGATTTPAGTTATRYLFPFITHTAEAIGGFLIVIFLSIYLAADPALYRRGILALLPDRRRAQGAYVMDRITVVLRKWLVTQLIAMLVIGVVTTIVLLLLGVKAAFALGLLAGLFEFIPTVGPLLSAIPGVAMGFLDSPEKAATVAVAYWGIQFLENHILIPLLMKGGMDLPPALTVITQALLALVFGFLGLMVAVPMLATVMVIVQVLYLGQRPDGSVDGDGKGRREAFDPDLDEALGGAATP